MDLSHLISLGKRYISENDSVITKLPGLSVLRRTEVSDIEATVYDPVMCLILQGSKTTSIGDQTVELHPGDALLVSHDLPVVSRITEASDEKPYLAAILTLDLGLVRSLYPDIPEVPATDDKGRSLSAKRADPAWVAPLIRYFELMDAPLDARVLGPATLREIHYRLLISPIGNMLRRLLIADSHASRISKAIRTMRAEFGTSISVPQLARDAGMSPSSFHEHFRSVTGTTPLQYLKDLRLIAAKTLLSEAGLTVSETAFKVGYESPTHFSRDYSRKFGLPPSREMEAGVSAA